MVSFFLYVQLLVAAAAAARAVLVVVVVASATFEANTTAQNMPRTFRFLCQTHKTKASTTRRWRLVKFSLVWFFFLPLFAFSFYVFVFTTVWRQFCCFPPSGSSPALPTA